MDEERMPAMEVVLPDNYRFKVGTTYNFGRYYPKVLLQRHVFWFFWETIDSSLPYSRTNSRTRDQLVQVAKHSLWTAEQERLEHNRIVLGE